MVFGYDDEKNVFSVIDTFRSFKYAPNEILYSEFKQAFYNFDEAENKREDRIIVNRFQDQNIVLDINTLKEELQSFYLVDESVSYVSGYQV